MKFHRKITRKAARAEVPAPKHSGVGYDLAKLKATDLESLKLSSDDNQLEVEVLLPVGDFDSVASYTEIFDLDAEHTPGWLIGAARAFAQACLRAVQEKHNMRREVPCATCTGACCKTFDSIRLTAYDVEKLEAKGYDVEKHIVLYRDAAWTGHVGEFRLVEQEGIDAKRKCPNLSDTGCSIYEFRPEVCREYSCWDCGVYEPDPAKIDGKVRLRVIQGGTP